MNKIKPSELIKEQILEKVRHYHYLKKDEEEESDRINYAGRYYDEREMVSLVESSLEFYLTAGRYTKEFERKLCDYLDVKYSLLTNSGSSSNLLAFFALTSPLLGNRQIKRGDSVITVSCCFPTTVAPILQYGAVPIFIDVNLDTVNIDISQLQGALREDTKAVMVAHTLGNPVNIEAIDKFCKDNNLWLILDSCDSLGSKYKGKYVEQYGDISTHSYFPAHIITGGQAGAVLTDNTKLYDIMVSMSEWGRKYNCRKCNECKSRFSRKEGNDCRYIFQHLGFNLRPTDLQASILCAQIDKLDNFIFCRKNHWKYLYDNLKDLNDYFIFQEAEKHSDPNWFSFLITLKNDVTFSRDDIVKYL
jgi:CDP-6-deoxy-D-xylo-4-hexulose-3-dehydrase